MSPGHRNRIQIEPLEPRKLLSTVPALSSLPSAFAKLYLDFNGAPAQQWGGYSVPATPEYDTDGDPSNFSSAELSNIDEIWQRVAEKFSPFNIDVTTVDPGNLNHRQTLLAIIGGDGSWVGGVEGGISFVGSFAGSSPNSVWVFPEHLNNGDPQIVAETTAHEAGHAFGLVHQSVWDSSGVLVSQYNPGDALTAPIMGNSYSAARGLWWDGPTETGPDAIQNDLAVIASPANGFGFRPDDHSNSLASPDPLSLSESSISASGVISRLSDVDVFSFTASAGNVNLSADTAPFGPMLDLKLSLYSSDGTLITTADTASLGESISMNLPTGTYELAVASHGSFGDVGQYTISGTINPYVPPAAPSGLSASAATPSQIDLSWNDNSSTETGFEIDRSSDNATWAQLATVAANTTSYSDTTVAQGSTYYYRVRAFDDVSGSSFSASASATTGVWSPVAPSNLTASAESMSQINLTWTDNSTNESGFNIERSSDDASWTPLASVGPNVAAYFDLGLPPGTTFFYRVDSFNDGGTSIVSNESSATTFTPAPAPPAPPAGLQATAASPTQINLSWTDDSNGEAGFYVERSPSGFAPWARVATLNANQTALEDSGLNPSTTYFYRVQSFSSNGVSGYTDSASAATLGIAIVPPAAPSSLSASAASSTEIDLTWTNNAPGATGFKIEQSTDGSSWLLAGTSSTATFQATGLRAATNYFFRVRAYNAQAESDVSNVASTATAAAPIYTVTLDSSSPTGITGTGVWRRSTAIAGYYGADYLTDGNNGKGKLLRFTPALASAGTYQLFIRWPAAVNRAKVVTVDVTSVDGTDQVKVNERVNGGQWVSLGRYNFDPSKSPAMITVRTGGTNGFVVADAVQLVQSTFDPTLSKPHKSTKKKPLSFRNNLQIKPAGTWTPGARAPFADDLRTKPKKAKPEFFSSSRIMSLMGL